MRRLNGIHESFSAARWEFARFVFFTENLAIAIDRIRSSARSDRAYTLAPDVCLANDKI